MANQAIGLLETKGLIALVQGTDAMLKSADVRLLGPSTDSGSGLVSATVTGDVAAVKAAIDSGAQAARELGEVVSAHVIARPHEDTSIVLPKTPAASKSAK